MITKNILQQRYAALICIEINTNKRNKNGNYNIKKDGYHYEKGKANS